MSTMFLENKYSNLYYKIINHYINRPIDKGYYEKHHIIPKSLGGSNDIDNIVDLPAKAHFVCHHLLTKMVENQYKIKMLHAFWRMVHAPQHSQPITAKVYQNIKEQRSKLLSKEMKGENNRFYGKKHSTTTKKIMSQKAKERGYSGNGFKDGHTPWNAGMSKESNTSIEKISAAKKGENNPMFGRTGKDHPNSVSFYLYDDRRNRLNKFESRKAFFDYCQIKNLPFNGLYKTLKEISVYNDGCKNGKYKLFNGWFLSQQ